MANSPEGCPAADSDRYVLINRISATEFSGIWKLWIGLYESEGAQKHLWKLLSTDRPSLSAIKVLSVLFTKHTIALASVSRIDDQAMQGNLNGDYMLTLVVPEKLDEEYAIAVKKRGNTFQVSRVIALKS